MASAVALKTWLERLDAKRFDDWTRERVIKEVPHTYFLGYLPVALDLSLCVAGVPAMVALDKTGNAVKTGEAKETAQA